MHENWDSSQRTLASPAGRITSKYRARVVVARARDRPARHSRERARGSFGRIRRRRLRDAEGREPRRRARVGARARRRARLRSPPPRATHDTTRRVETSWRNVTPTRRASLPRLARRANPGRATRRPSRACTISCITPSSPPRREGARRAARSARRRNRATPPAKTPPSSCSCRSRVFRVRRGCSARPARVLTSPLPRPPRANQGDAEADLPRLQDARAHRDQACVPRPRDASPTHHRRAQTASVAPWTDGATILKRFLGRARA